MHGGFDDGKPALKRHSRKSKKPSKPRIVANLEGVQKSVTKDASVVLSSTTSTISLSTPARDVFLETTKLERVKREESRLKTQSLVLIQRFVRGWIVRKNLKQTCRAEYDRKLNDIEKLQMTLKISGVNFIVPPEALFKITLLCLWFCDVSHDYLRFVRLLDHIQLSVETFSRFMMKKDTNLWKYMTRKLMKNVYKGLLKSTSSISCPMLRFLEFLYLQEVSILNTCGFPPEYMVIPLDSYLWIRFRKALESHPSPLKHPWRKELVEQATLLMRFMVKILSLEFDRVGTSITKNSKNDSIKRNNSDNNSINYNTWDIISSHFFTYILSIPLVAKRIQFQISTPSNSSSTNDKDKEFFSGIVLPPRLFFSMMSVATATQAYLDCTSLLTKSSFDEDVGDNSLWLLGNLLEIVGTKQLYLHPPKQEAFDPGDIASFHRKLLNYYENLNIYLNLLAQIVESIDSSAFDYNSPIIWRKLGKNQLSTITIPSSLRDQLRLLTNERWIHLVSQNALKLLNDTQLKVPRSKGDQMNSKEMKDYYKKLFDDHHNKTGLMVTSRSNNYNATVLVNSIKKTSAWAMKLTKKIFSRNKSASSSGDIDRNGFHTNGVTTTTATSSTGGTTFLVNTSASAHQLASGETRNITEHTISKALPSQVKSSSSLGWIKTPYYNPGIFSFSRMFALYLSKRNESGSNNSSSLDAAYRTVINTLSFATNLPQILWNFIQNEFNLNNSSKITSVHSLLPSIEKSRCVGFPAVFGLWAACYAHMLQVLDDFEIYERQFPISLIDINSIVLFIKDLLLPIYTRLPNESSATAAGTSYGKWLIGIFTKLLKDIYDRNGRRLLCPKASWLGASLATGIDSRSIALQARLLYNMPYTVAFRDRLRFFEERISAERLKYQPKGARPAYVIHINRLRVFEDGLSKLGKFGKELRRRIGVIFLTVDGREEAGMDIGGALQRVLDLSVGYCVRPFLWVVSAAKDIFGGDYLDIYHFLGLILGKAIFESITVQPQLAHFFLRKLLGKHNGINELPSMDSELYKNLMFLKTYDGDCEDLCLDFTVTNESFGNTSVLELIPGGSNVTVSNSNKIKYIHLMANYRMNMSIKHITESFCRGFHELIPVTSINIFSESELQTLISGDGGNVDIEDLKRNTRYSGGYFMFDGTIRAFWRVLQSFSNAEISQLLRFVTSCERSPPLGFEQLSPFFCIHKVPLERGEDRLPTASTCFNTLKLPAYSNEKILREKLLYAIQSGSGFEMS